MTASISTDKNGQYYYDGNRMLVSHIRGEWIDRPNPLYKVGRYEYNPYEAELLQEYYWGPVGTVVCLSVQGELRFGYSKVNLKAGDRFSKKLAVRVAINRALYDQIEPPFEGLRPQIQDALTMMQYRAKNYFKYLQR